MSDRKLNIRKVMVNGVEMDLFSSEPLGVNPYLVVNQIKHAKIDEAVRILRGCIKAVMSDFVNKIDRVNQALDNAEACGDGDE